MTQPLLYSTGGSLSRAELSAACIDGDLIAVDDAYIPADAVETAALRAASLAPLLGGALAAIGMSAAWVHGALGAPPARHRVARTVPRRVGNLVGRRVVFHDAQIPAADLCRPGGVPVTTPTRTLCDLVRSREAAAAPAGRALVQAGLADVSGALAWFAAAGPVWGKARALRTLHRWAREAGQLEVTR